MKTNKQKITFTGIGNEVQLNMITDAAERVGAKFEILNLGCKVVVTTKLNAFEKEYAKE